MTPSQYALIKNHPNLDWVRRHVKMNQAMEQSTLRSKIAEAIKSKLPNMATETNISYVARQCGAFYGDVFQPNRDLAVRGMIAQDAADEIIGVDIELAKSLKMVFQNTATGRTSPGTMGINHIHIGGNAQRNLLFVVDTSVVLGVVDGHMDSKMSPSIRSQADRVNLRKNQATIAVTIIGNTIQRG